MNWLWAVAFFNFGVMAGALTANELWLRSVRSWWK